MKSIWTWISNLVGNNPKTRYAIFAFILMFIVVAVRCAHADELHLETGVSALHGVGPYMGLYYRFGGTSDKGLAFETGAQFWGSTSPYQGNTIQNNWAPEVMLDVSRGPLQVGFGFANLIHTDRLDGTNLNISLKIRYAPQWAHSEALVIRHLSNAGCCTGPNIGRNAIAIDWRLR